MPGPPTFELQFDRLASALRESKLSPTFFDWHRSSRCSPLQSAGECSTPAPMQRSPASDPGIGARCHPTMQLRRRRRCSKQCPGRDWCACPPRRRTAIQTPLRPWLPLWWAIAPHDLQPRQQRYFHGEPCAVLLPKGVLGYHLHPSCIPPRRELVVVARSPLASL